MRNKITKNLALKIGSLLLAMLVWVLITNINNPVKTRVFSDVKITVENEDSMTEIDKAFDIISDDSVAIKVTERKSVLFSLSKDDFTVTADMENLTEMDTVPLKVSCSNPSVTWDELEIEPASIKVKMEQMKQCEFAVNVNVSGDPVKGFEIGKTEVVSGKTVQIAGAESLVNKINQVVAAISVSQMRSDQRVEATLKIYDKNGDAFTDAQMSRLQIKDSEGILLASDSVMVDVTLWEVLNDIPIEFELSGTPEDGYIVYGSSILPPTVNLVGTKEALAEINGRIIINEPVSVEGKSESFSMDVDLTDTLADISGLRLVSGADPVVTISVQIERNGDQTIMLPLSNLNIRNKPEKMLLTYSPADSLTIIVHSDDLQAEALHNSDILAEIDLGECAVEGTYEIPVKLELPEGYTLVSDISLVVTSEKVKDKESESAKTENTK